MTHIDPATVRQCIDALTKLLPVPEQTEVEHLARMITNPDAGPIVEKPPLVFGPWIGAQDGKTPDFPVGWSYQMRNAQTGEVNPYLMQMVGRHPSRNTEYRAVFTVGKWYDWNRTGECPLPADTWVQLLWDDETESDFDTDTYQAGVLDWNEQKYSEWVIKKFRIVGDNQ